MPLRQAIDFSAKSEGKTEDSPLYIELWGSTYLHLVPCPDGAERRSPPALLTYLLQIVSIIPQCVSFFTLRSDPQGFVPPFRCRRVLLFSEYNAPHPYGHRGRSRSERYPPVPWRSCICNPPIGNPVWHYVTYVLFLLCRRVLGNVKRV